MEIMNISGIECYEKDGMVYLKLETCARGLGFTTVATSGNEVVRWKRVEKYLSELGIATSCDEKLPEFIPENIFYRLAMKAKNEAAEAFQAKIADEVFPLSAKPAAILPDKLKCLLMSLWLKLCWLLKEPWQNVKLAFLL